LQEICILESNLIVKLSQVRISLLIELLKSFSEKELTGFAKFIENTYFNEDKKLVELLKKIKRYALKTEKFTAELQLKVYEVTFCETPLKQKELTKAQYIFLNNKQHKLLRLAEQFLIIENLKTKDAIKMKLLYEPLIDKNQINLYQRHLKSDTKKLNDENEKGIDYYNKQHKLQEVIVDFLIKSGQIRKEDNYDELHYYLNLNYVLEKLKYHLAQITLKSVYQSKSYKFSALTEIRDLLKLPLYSENLLVKIYLNNINLVETQSEASFKDLMEILAVNQNSLPPLFSRVFYNNLTNFCASQIRKGHIDYYKNLFDIYKIMHQSNLLMFDNLMDTVIIKNVINVSCRVKEFKWAYKILEYYKKFIHPENRESIYFYNKGVIAFQENNFSAAQDWFLKVDKINDTYEIGLRIFILQCIYELEADYNDATEQSFESAKRFFRRTFKLSTLKRTSYINFITIFTLLYKYKHKATKMNLSKIKDKLQKMDVVHNKKWLLDKTGPPDS